MNTIYKVVKRKTKAKGFWIDNGKIYRDNIEIIPFQSNGELQYNIEKLFKLGELAVFYIIGNTAYIKSREGSISKFKHKVEWKEKTLKPSYIKALINQHKGLTITRENSIFILTIWK